MAQRFDFTVLIHSHSLISFDLKKQKKKKSDLPEISPYLYEFHLWKTIFFHSNFQYTTAFRLNRTSKIKIILTKKLKKKII